MSVSEPTTGRRGLDIAAALAIVALAASQWFRPHLVANEAVYLIPPLQWWAPGTLANDWTWGGDPWRSTSLLFGWLAAPLWALSEQPEIVALVGRALAWLALGLAIVKLARALDVGRFWAVLGVGLFLLVGQGFAAGEWMFLGFERKPLCHAAALMALREVLRGRPTLAGGWLGLAGAFHVLVGGWFGLAIGAGALLRAKAWGPGGIGRFVGAGALVGGPFVAMSVIYLLSSDASASGAADVADPSQAVWLTTAFRNPHHTLPSHFLNAGKNLLIVSLALGASWGAFSRSARPEATILSAVIAVAVAAWALGWWAGKQGWLAVLQYYPFRLGDVLIPLLACLLIPPAVARTFRQVQDREPPVGTEPFKERKRRLSGHRGAALVALAVLLFFVQGRAPEGAQRVKDTTGSWPVGTPITQKMGDFAGAHTPANAVFIAPPCLFDFWIRTRRAAVVSYKAMPHGPRAVQWLQRLEAVSAPRSIEGTGFEVCKGLQAGHAALTEETLRGLSARFGATHYLLRGRRPELARAEIYRDVRFAVYDVRKLDPVSAPQPAEGP